MSEPVKAGAGPTRPSTSSSLSTIGWAVVAFALLVVLLDAAVETFWSGSPLRWWIALPVVAFVALSVWLWRPGGAAAKRRGAFGAAGWSLGGLLFLLAVTAWLPDGQTSGVRMLFQPTATVLTAATMGAVILAAFALFRALALLPAGARTICRAVVIGVAVYAVVALGLAIHERTPFAALFQGGGAWQRLPRWLQGTFLGALVLVPLAVVFQVVRFVDHMRRQAPLRLLIHQTTALVMALVMALSGTTLPTGPAVTTQIQTSAAPAAIETAVRALNQSRSDFAELLTGAGQRKVTQAPPDRARLDAFYAGLKEVNRSLPRETFDPKAVAERIGSDPVKLFEWVRDNTSLVPYRGVLRGPVGVLMDRVGNSLDRALLLARLLTDSRLNARLAHATISPAQAQSLLSAARRARRVDTSDDAAAALLGGVSRILGTDAATLRKQADAFGESASAFSAAVNAQADARSSMLLEALATLRDPGPPPREDPLLDHWWVQTQRDGVWLDLDPSDPAAGPGTSLAPAAQTLRPDGLPANLFHQVEIRVVAEQRLNGRLQEQVALRKTLRPADLAGRSVTVAHIPLSLEPTLDLVQLDTGLARRLATAARQEEIWLPVLSDGKEIVTQKLVSTSGQTEDMPTEAAESGTSAVAAPPAGGLGGFLGGGEKPAPKAPPESLASLRARMAGNGDLTAEWIEYAITVPQAQPRIVRRVVWDLLGPAARKVGTIDRSVSDGDRLARGLALLSETEVLLLGNRLAPSYVTSRKLQSLLDNRAPLETLLGAQGPADSKQTMETLARLSAPPGPLFDLALMRNSATAESETMFLAEPNILSLHSALAGSDLNALRAFRAFDIVWNKVAIREGTKGDPFTLLVRHGTFDSIAEEALLRQDCCSGERPDVSGAISAGSGPASPFHVLRSDSDLARVPLPPDVRELVADALRAGHVVVMPGADAAQTGWWTIDPATGQTLFVGSRGWGQSLTDQAKLVWAVATIHIKGWVPLVVKLVALSVCIITNVSTAQAADPAHKTAAAVGFAAGTALCLGGAAAGLGSMAVSSEASLLPRLVAIFAEVLGMALEMVHQLAEHADEQIEATREGVKEKK